MNSARTTLPFRWSSASNARSVESVPSVGTFDLNLSSMYAREQKTRRVETYGQAKYLCVRTCVCAVAREHDPMIYFVVKTYVWSRWLKARHLGSLSLWHSNVVTFCYRAARGHFWGHLRGIYRETVCRVVSSFGAAQFHPFAVWAINCDRGEYVKRAIYDSLSDQSNLGMPTWVEDAECCELFEIECNFGYKCSANSYDVTWFKQSHQLGFFEHRSQSITYKNKKLINYPSV